MSARRTPRTPKPPTAHAQHELFQALHDEVARLQGCGISRPLARLAEENPELWQGVKDAVAPIFTAPPKRDLSPATTRRRIDTLRMFVRVWQHPANADSVLSVLRGATTPEEALLSPEAGDECEQARREAEVWAESQACLLDHDPLERARVIASYHLSVWQARWYLPGVADVTSVVKARNPVLARAYAEWLHDVDPHAPKPDEPFLGEPFLHQREDAQAVQQVRDERAILADIEGMIARDDIEGVFAKYLPQQADQCHALRELQAKTAATARRGKSASREDAAPGAGPAAATEAKDADPQARALATLVRHPDWTDKQIAESIGVARTSLYRWAAYKKARQTQATDRDRLPTGRKTAAKDEGPDIDAWDEEER